MKRHILFFIGFFLASSFTGHVKPSLTLYVKQGVRGYVRELKGNQMPSPSRPLSRGKGFAATLCIFKLVNLSQVEPDRKASFYKAVHAPLVKTIQADSTGYFEASLDTGSYSLFIKVDNSYYANLRDQYNNLAPIRVQAGQVAHIDLTYKDLVTY
ncbi:MAG TPA: hypothetical protein VL547_21040 [Dinghuibacter sp.]|uniref:hypothetical protein n=1 Tax=Dinghuibacter sp. TaxID=2024697 RepID=UPI002BB3776B|nr:hypothetical protein [Dinghuibacter sp.]HTJ14544.1 hypothetical protein [Dinghuibacter sp.]